MRALVFACVLLAAASAGAQASPSIRVSPVTVEFAPGKRIAAVRVHNESDRPLAFETEMLGWSQSRGADVLTDAGAVVVTPPAFVVPARKEQIVRIALPDAAAAGAERSYRLILTQAYLDAGDPETDALRVRLRMSLPVFAAPAAARTTAPSLAIVNAGGAPVLRIANPGARRVQLLSLEAGADARALRTPRYLLAGESVDVPLTGAESGGFRLRYSAGGGPLRQVDFAGTLDAP
jgi:fimbrial chaperone protein